MDFNGSVGRERQQQHAKIQSRNKIDFSADLIEPCNCTHLKYHRECIREKIVNG